jgi:probable addiction module antidote protein
MTTTKTTKWDVVNNLKNEAAIKAYLEAAFEDGDPNLIVAAMGDVARARGGMSKLSKATGLRRELLYQSFSKTGNPQASTLFKVMKALNIRLTTHVSLTRDVPKRAAEQITQRRA